MAQPYYPPNNQNPAYAPASAQNLQFYSSSYPEASGHGSAAQGSYGYAPSSTPSFGGGGGGFNAGFGAAPGVSGRMGEQGGLRTGWLAAFSTEGYDGEPPLLEELSINFGHIKTKTIAVLNPFSRIPQNLMDDSDIGGPMLFFLLFGTFLLLSGKVHFGFIYGLALLGTVSLHLILSLMSPTDSPHHGAAEPHPYPSSSSYPEPAGAGAGGVGGPGNLSSTLTMARSASVLGFCFLPLVATSLVGVALPMDTPLGIVMTSAAIMYCTYSASGIFCAVGRMKHMRVLVAYPLALFYAGFGIMSVFSSRGSGSMAKVMAGGAKMG